MHRDREVARERGSSHAALVPFEPAPARKTSLHFSHRTILPRGMTAGATQKPFITQGYLNPNRNIGG